MEDTVRQIRVRVHHVMKPPVGRHERVLFLYGEGQVEAVIDGMIERRSPKRRSAVSMNPAMATTMAAKGPNVLRLSRTFPHLVR